MSQRHLNRELRGVIPLGLACISRVSSHLAFRHFRPCLRCNQACRNMGHAFAVHPRQSKHGGLPAATRGASPRLQPTVLRFRGAPGREPYAHDHESGHIPLAGLLPVRRRCQHHVKLAPFHFLCHRPDHRTLFLYDNHHIIIRVSFQSRGTRLFDFRVGDVPGQHGNTR